MNELLLLSGCGMYMDELIEIPEYTTVVYLSSLIEELSLVKMAEINKELGTIDYNRLSNIINNQEQLIINDNKISIWIYKSNTMINDNYFNIQSGIINVTDIFNNDCGTFKVLQGLYNLPINNDIITSYKYPENTNYKMKELLQKDCIKHSSKKTNFSLKDIFNEINKNNKKTIKNRILLIMASRNKYNQDDVIE
jgi:hypothetical protein